MFLTLSEINKLQGDLGRVFAKSSKSKKIDKSMYYLLEPEKGTVHVIQGEANLELIKGKIESGEIIPEKIARKDYRKIPEDFTTYGISLERGKYHTVKNWGARHKLMFLTELNLSKDTYNLVRIDGPDNQVVEIELPDTLKQGDLAEKRAKALTVIFSSHSQQDFIDRAGVSLDPDTRDKLQEILKDVFESARNKMFDHYKIERPSYAMA